MLILNKVYQNDSVTFHLSDIDMEISEGTYYVLLAGLVQVKHNCWN